MTATREEKPGTASAPNPTSAALGGARRPTSGPATGGINFGGRTYALRFGPFSNLHRRRAVIVCGAIVVAILALGVVSLGYGTLALSPGEVLAALFDADAARAHRLVVFEWRLPRFLFAVLAGLALGASGAIFQSITRNPLGSPDIIGFSTGSYTGAIIVMLWIGSTSYYAIGAGALLGGAAVALAVYLLAYRKGLRPFRLIIVGIGASAMLASVNSLMMMRVSQEEAMLAAVWGSGSLSALGYAQLLPATLIFVALIIGCAFLGRPLAALEVGDDAALSLGVHANRTRAFSTLIGVALTALVTAAAGPIAFISLAAPQIARRLTNGASLQLLPSALVGALLLVAADLVAQMVDLPVGVLTVCVGGIYLAWLLVHEQTTKKGRQ
ncbi:iron complex transport system permease protein [Pseudoclavibacter sp. JAI123]|uniref:FecCD family ABC transporter permease n=1 Tax=Pseudoclavibacter sp. JAI123 TaxID=2723065 RepID=UPI001830503E|nr:iron chelate uptake ABC transporter family permease subunit [Pseudoclavibacter sp. JAI123]NYF14760.1 iron complex transport system permease protein [Pseudoclavibacter sp. JAI123]